MANRVLKIDKNLDDDGKLVISKSILILWILNSNSKGWIMMNWYHILAEDATIYTSSQLKALIEQLTLGNAASGGLTRPIDTFWGIVG